MRKYQAIIFDLGGVIINPQGITPLMLAQIFNLSPQKISKVYNQQLEDDWTKGRLSALGIVKKLKKEYATTESTDSLFALWRQTYQKGTKVDASVLKLVDQLRGTYRLYLLTNTTDLQHQVNSQRGIYEHFDKVFTSFTIGLIKPQPQIYEYLLDQIKLPARSCLFIDDRQIHLDAARKIGIKTLLFKSLAQLKQELKTVLPSATKAI